MLTVHGLLEIHHPVRPNMSLWFVRTGKFGEHEQRFLSDNRIYLTWGGLDVNLAKLGDRKDVVDTLLEVSPNKAPARARNHAGQVWAFAKRMQLGDWVVIPSKAKPAIHVAEITGEYKYEGKAVDPYFHSRSVKWIAKDIPRSVFDQDLLYSFGAIMTIAKIKRNDAEARVKGMAKAGWTGQGSKAKATAASGEDLEEDSTAEIEDLEQFARDQIAKHIIRRFKGHGLERLVDGILQAQGYTTYHSPEGPDKGIDILAAPGPLGFGSPRICVQVKSSDSPVDAATMNQLIGSMQNVHAEQGLLVSWGGFKSSIDKEVPTQFFRVRFWDQEELINQLFEHYDRLDEALRTELPLKRMWALSVVDETDG